MGHGFVMAPAVYANLWSHFVPKGYIMVLPTTEGGFAPSHGNFGQDLAFLGVAMQDAGGDGASPFFGRVAAATALMGHSMGGGASFLGAAGNGAIQALVNFAPAETNPSAVGAAQTVLVPTLVFAASEDCVTPIPDHQGPMYTATAAACRAFVNILGGGHCYFANDNFNCTFGEFTCGPDLTISRTEQHDVVNDLAGLWLDHFLKGDAAAFPAFSDSVANSTRVEAQLDCLTTGVPVPASDDQRLFPVPASDRIHVIGALPGTACTVMDARGKEVITVQALPVDGAIDVSALPMGTYHLILRDAKGIRTEPFVVVR